MHEQQSTPADVTEMRDAKRDTVEPIAVLLYSGTAVQYCTRSCIRSCIRVYVGFVLFFGLHSLLPGTGTTSSSSFLPRAFGTFMIRPRSFGRQKCPARAWRCEKATLRLATLLRKERECAGWPRPRHMSDGAADGGAHDGAPRGCQSADPTWADVPGAGEQARPSRGS